MTRSFFDLFRHNLDTHPDATAARFKHGGAWREMTWAGMGARIDAVSAGLLRLGVDPGDRVSVLSNTRIEWPLADLGIVGAGAVTVPIYQSNTPEEAAYILQDSGAVAVFAEDAAQVAKLREIRGEIPRVRRVVCFEPGTATGDDGWEVDWQRFLAEGEEAAESLAAEIRERRDALEPPALATLIYTSGTTGRPKGVRVTHDNLVVAGEATTEVGIFSTGDIQLLFLPLAHSFAKLLTVGWYATGSVMAFAESIEKVVDNMGEVRPTFMASVPRVFEKVHAKVVAEATGGSGLQGKIARWGLAQGERAARLETRGERPGGLGWKLARALVFKKVGVRLHERFGGRLRFFISGGAPLAREIAWFFHYAGVTICEGYGLTETSSVTSVNLPGEVAIGTVGPPVPAIEVEIADDGEIFLRGRTIFDGYWGQPEATAEVLSEDGWFATGDIGEIDGDGHLVITDRKKDLIITAGGKNVAPQNIENQLKSKSPLISQAVVYGDRRPYLVALVTLDEAALSEWGEAHGLAGDAATLSQRPETRDLVREAVSSVNRELARYESLKRVTVLDHDFEVGDQLTPTLKVRRKRVNERYHDVFEELYADPPSPRVVAF